MAIEEKVDIGEFYREHGTKEECKTCRVPEMIENLHTENKKKYLQGWEEIEEEIKKCDSNCAPRSVGMDYFITEWD